MDPFSYKADLEAQALQEWIEVIHKNLVRCLLRALVRSVRRLLRAGVQAGIQRAPDHVDHPARDWTAKKQV